MSDKATDHQAWGLPGVLDFFAERRGTGAEVYPSEWFFLKDRLKEGLSILDIGCAQGGFAQVIAERIKNFCYVGADVNAEMIARARTRLPQHTFIHVREGDFSALGDEKFDLVLALGILHLHETWRETLAAAWARTGGAMIFDLREWSGLTIADRSQSYMTMDFHRNDNTHKAIRLPYILLNSDEARQIVFETCIGARTINHHDYAHAPSATAVTPAKLVTMNTWCAER